MFGGTSVGAAPCLPSLHVLDSPTKPNPNLDFNVGAVLRTVYVAVYARNGHPADFEPIQSHNMPWDNAEIEIEPVDQDPPDNLLACIQQVYDDEDLQLESVMLARRVAKPGQKPSNFVKYATYHVTPRDEPHDVCEEILGGTEAAQRSDAEQATGKYCATIVWKNTITGKRERDRVPFDWRDADPRPGTRQAAAQHHQIGISECPACASMREVAGHFRGHARTLQKDLEQFRVEHIATVERLMESIDRERGARDSLAQAIATLGQDAARIGHDAARDAREAWKPTKESTDQILGMLGAAIKAYQGAIDAQMQQATFEAETKARAQNKELLGDALKSAQAIGMTIIKAKFGHRMPPDEPTTEAKPGENQAVTSARSKLYNLRDALFAKATPADWKLIEDTTGPDFYAMIRGLHAGEIDAGALQVACMQLFVEPGTAKMLGMMQALTEPTQETLMGIIDIVDKVQAEEKGGASHGS